MNRRQLLRLAIGAAFIEDPERLLWRPGAKLISIPAPKSVIISCADFKVGDIFTMGIDFASNPRWVADQWPSERKYIVTAVTKGAIDFEPLGMPAGSALPDFVRRMRSSLLFIPSSHRAMPRASAPEPAPGQAPDASWSRRSS